MPLAGALRLIVGYGFMAHGFSKLSKGPDAFAAILQAMGVPGPHLIGVIHHTGRTTMRSRRTAGRFRDTGRLTDGRGAPRSHIYRAFALRVQFDQIDGRD